MPPYKMSLDTVVHEVELPGRAPLACGQTPKQPIMSNKENIYLIYC
jgi:hypothetical protein